MRSSDAHVPIEQRWLGLDKRALPSAAVMVFFIALMAYVAPAVNSAVGWTDETRPGDVIDLGDGLTITPPSGWLLQAGIRTSENPAVPVSPSNASAAFTSDGVTVTVAASGWTGDANELLDQYNRLRDRSDADDDRLFQVTAPRSSVTTDNGLMGVTETFTSATGDGRVYAFAVDVAGRPTGVVITVDASSDNLASVHDEVDRAVSSLSVSETPS